MIAPTAFESNAQATSDNHFMSPSPNATSAASSEMEDLVSTQKARLRARVVEEHASIIRVLREEIGAVVHVFDHAPEHGTPDAVFPNNWFSTDIDGRLILYPMRHPNRRAERRPDLVEFLREKYRVPDGVPDGAVDARGDDARRCAPSDSKLIDLTSEEQSDECGFLEGTGALVLDRSFKVAYACVSERCDARVARRWARLTGYDLVLFRAVDERNRPIYHTNVMMSVGTRGALLCRPSFVDENEYRAVRERLRADGVREIIDIDHAQMENMCGNVLEICSSKESGSKKCLLMSQRAFESFSEKNQMDSIRSSWDSVHVASIPTIEEVGGGGVRCCVAELF